MQIVPIPDDPAVRSIVARWSDRAWSADFPGDTEHTYLDLYARSSADGSALPYVCVAMNDDCAIGTATLIDDDELPGFEIHGPWLAAVWVEPEYRSRGVANAMVAHIESVTRSLGHSELFLYTHDQMDWYARHNWHEFGVGTLAVHHVTVMRKIL